MLVYELLIYEFKFFHSYVLIQATIYITVIYIDNFYWIQTVLPL